MKFCLLINSSSAALNSAKVSVLKGYSDFTETATHAKSFLMVLIFTIAGPTQGVPRDENKNWKQSYLVSAPTQIFKKNDLECFLCKTEILLVNVFLRVKEKAICQWTHFKTQAVSWAAVSPLEILC